MLESSEPAREYFQTTDLNERRLSARRRSATGAAPATCQVRLADDDATRDDAYALRYRSYLNAGAIGPNATGRFSDRYDALESARTMVIYVAGQAVASVRACLLARGDAAFAPCQDAFPDEVATLLATNTGSGVDAIEVNRLVVCPDQHDVQEMVFLLYRLAGLFAVRHDAGMAISCVRPRHAAFYRRLGFSTVAPPRLYPGLRVEMQLMACPRPRYDAACRAVPVMDPNLVYGGLQAGFFRGEPLQMPIRPGR